MEEIARLTKEIEELKEALYLSERRGKWSRITKYLPIPGRSYLIYADYKGVTTYDVAFYQGVKPNGEHWWILSNTSIDHKCIVSWMPIREVDDD